MSSQKLKFFFFKGGLGVGASSQKLKKKNQTIFERGLGVGGVISKTQKKINITFLKGG